MLKKLLIFLGVMGVLFVGCVAAFGNAEREPADNSGSNESDITEEGSDSADESESSTGTRSFGETATLTVDRKVSDETTASVDFSFTVTEVVYADGCAIARGEVTADRVESANGLVPELFFPQPQMVADGIALEPDFVNCLNASKEVPSPYTLQIEEGTTASWEEHVPLESGEVSAVVIGDNRFEP